MILKAAPLGILIIGILLIALAAGQKSFTQPGQCRNFSEGELHIGETTFSVGFANSSRDQAKGLAGCTEVPDTAGLYFPYDPPRIVSFWMRGMLIPIDIIWIGEEKVIGIKENLQPPTDPASTNLPTFEPPTPVTGVLEIKAGGVEEYGINIDDQVTLTK